MGRAANFDHAEAARYARITEAFIHRVHGTDAMHAELLINESADAYKRGSASEALRLAREAMTFADRFGQDMGRAQRARRRRRRSLGSGELEESSKIAEAEYATERTLFGDTNPSTLRTRCDIGEAQTQLGEYAAAVATLEPIVQGERARDDPRVRRMLLGQAMIGAGRTADGIATFEEGTAIFREVKMDEEQIADDTADLARALVQRDEDTAAEAYAARALAGMQEIRRTPGRARRGLRRSGPGGGHRPTQRARLTRRSRSAPKSDCSARGATWSRGSREAKRSSASAARKRGSPSWRRRSRSPIRRRAIPPSGQRRFAASRAIRRRGETSNARWSSRRERRTS